jgi:tetratricopeptide (TPR) repeat protein
MKNEIEKIKKEVKKFGTNPQGLFMIGQKLLVKGDFKSARGKFRLALMYDPRLASKVALCYESILIEENGNINARLSLADLHLFLGEVEGAISELEEIIDIAPDRADIYTMLGKLYIKHGDVDSAIVVIENAFKAGVKDTSLVEMLAGAYIEKKRINNAISLYRGLLSADATNKNYLRVLADLLSRVNLPDEAAKNYYSMVCTDASSATEVIIKLEELKKQNPGNIYIKEVLADIYIKAIKPSLAVSELNEVLMADNSRLDSIISKFKEILDKYPDEPATLKALGRALTLKGAFSEAVDEYKKLIRFSNQYIDDAIDGFKDVLNKYPGQLHARESLGDAYFKLGRTEEALLEYLEVLKLDGNSSRSIIEKCLKMSKENPNMILVHHVLGQAYVLSGDGSSALEEAEFMIYLDKTFAPAYQIMGDAHMKMGSAAKAQSSYVDAMKLDPFNISIHKKYATSSTAILRGDIENLKKRADTDPWRLGIHLDIAKLYLLIEDFDKAIKELQIAVKDTGRAPFAYNLLGLAFIELGRFDLAAIQFERSLETMPKELSDISRSVRFNLGAAYEAMGNVSAAIAEYEMILAEDVEFASLQGRLKNLGSISSESLRNKMIAAVIEKYASSTLIGMWAPDLRRKEISEEILNMSFGQEHNSAGYEHFIKGRFKGATEEFSLAVQLDPKFCAALNNLSIMQLREGSFEQAQTRLQLALSLDPEYAALHNNMGVYYYLKKDIDSAIAEFNKALQCDPNLSATYINLGDCMYMKGSAQHAISLWEKVKINDPLSPIAIRRLAYKTISG